MPLFVAVSHQDLSDTPYRDENWIYRYGDGDEPEAVPSAVETGTRLSAKSA